MTGKVGEKKKKIQSSFRNFSFNYSFQIEITASVVKSAARISTFFVVKTRSCCFYCHKHDRCMDVIEVCRLLDSIRKIENNSQCRSEINQTNKRVFCFIVDWRERRREIKKTLPQLKMIAKCKRK